MPKYKRSCCLFVLALAAVFLGLTSIACYRFYLIWRDAPPRPMATVDLLARVEDFSAGWQVLEGPKRAWTDIAVRNSQGIMFQKDNGPSPLKSTSFVYNYGSEFQAMWLYFRVVGPRQFGDTPPEWRYISPIANASSFACYTYQQTGLTSCEWAARYSEYIVEYIAPLKEGQMTLQDIERVVRQVDARMAQNLGR